MLTSALEFWNTKPVLFIPIFEARIFPNMAVTLRCSRRTGRQQPHCGRLPYGKQGAYI
jgi:hypothetical protein